MQIWRRFRIEKGVDVTRDLQLAGQRGPMARVERRSRVTSTPFANTDGVCA